MLYDAENFSDVYFDKVYCIIAATIENDVLWYPYIRVRIRVENTTMYLKLK